MTPLTLIRLRCRLPILRTDDRQTHLPFLVDVRVVDAGLEADLWRLERILRRESDFYFEGTLVIRRIFLQRHRHQP